MIAATTRVLAPLMATALLFGAVSACDSGGDGEADKAGGSEAPKLLRLAVADDAEQPDAPFARYFARRVSARSDGSVRVRVVWDAAGQSSPGYELGIAQRVRDGDFELGWMGSRAWDRMGITSFQALQAPFLVTDYGLLGRIATGAPAERMLAGLDGHGFVGLGLVPEHLRYAFGVREPLASVDDFAGARVRVRPSEATDALMHALGAKPVHISGDDVAAAVADGKIDGAEASLGTNSREEGENHLTVNLPLFPKTLTVFAGEDAYDQLEAGQREAIREAARETAAYAAAHPPSERALMREFCLGGGGVSAVAATRGDLDALERAAQPVYAQLEEDPDTKALIAAIRALRGRVTRASGGCPTGGVHTNNPHREWPEAVPVGRQRHLSLARDRGRRACGGAGSGRLPKRRRRGHRHRGQDDASRRQVAYGRRRPRGLLRHLRDHRQPARVRLGRRHPHLRIRSRGRRDDPPRAAAADEPRRRGRVGRRTMAACGPARARHSLTRCQGI